MGYEITLLVVETYKNDTEGNPVGYCSVVASVDLSNCGSGNLSELDSRRPKNLKELDRLVYEVGIAEKECFTSDGDYTARLQNMTKEEREKETDKYNKIRGEVDSVLPYIYYTDGNLVDYQDDCGSLLRVCSVEEVYKAILQDQADCIAKGEFNSPYGYRRFDIALSILRPLLNTEAWPRIKVMLWGH